MRDIYPAPVAKSRLTIWPFGVDFLLGNVFGTVVSYLLLVPSATFNCFYLILLYVLECSLDFNTSVTFNTLTFPSFGTYFHVAIRREMERKASWRNAKTALLCVNLISSDNTNVIFLFFLLAETTRTTTPTTFPTIATTPPTTTQSQKCWPEDRYLYLADNISKDRVVAIVPLPTIGHSVNGGGGNFASYMPNFGATKNGELVTIKTVVNNVVSTDKFQTVYFFSVSLTQFCQNLLYFRRRSTPSLTRSSSLPPGRSGLLLNVAEYSVNVSQPATGLSNFSICGATSTKLAFSLTYNSTTGILSVNVNQSFIPIQTSSSPLRVNLSVCLTDNADGKVFKPDDSTHNFTSYHNGVSNITVAVTIPKRKFLTLI